MFFILFDVINIGLQSEAQNSTQLQPEQLQNIEMDSTTGIKLTFFFKEIFRLKLLVTALRDIMSNKNEYFPFNNF